MHIDESESYGSILAAKWLVQFTKLIRGIAMTRTYDFPYRAATALLAVFAIAAVGIAHGGQAFGAETWHGLVIAPEHRCAPYDRDDYPYSRSVEDRIVATMGGRVYGPYTGRYFLSARSTDIEHIVAVSEAHDSGLCAADQTVRRRFASDLLNLTLAAPEVNRCGSGGKMRLRFLSRLAAADEPLLVRGAHRRSQACVRFDCRPA